MDVYRNRIYPALVNLLGNPKPIQALREQMVSLAAGTVKHGRRRYNSRLRLAPGTQLGQYSIVLPLGAGGMGEVYRARDTRLERDVALKSLSKEFSADPERRQRFGREAQTLALLNHPHIAHIYGLEDTGDIQALLKP
jgi:serine/threonine protein kinase